MLPIAPMIVVISFPLAPSREKSPVPRQHVENALANALGQRPRCAVECLGGSVSLTAYAHQPPVNSLSIQMGQGRCRLYGVLKCADPSWSLLSSHRWSALEAQQPKHSAAVTHGATRRTTSTTGATIAPNIRIAPAKVDAAIASELANVTGAVTIGSRGSIGSG